MADVKYVSDYAAYKDAPGAILVERSIFMPFVQACLDGGDFELVDLNTGVHLGLYKGRRLLFVVAQFSPHCAIKIEQIHRSFGVTNVLRVGTCGGLQPDLKLGDLVLATDAVRGEGTSACYVEPSWPAAAAFSLTSALHGLMRKRRMSHHVGSVWTTDGQYMETDDLLQKYSCRGVLAVDMESAALFVVARLRGMRAASLGIVCDLPITEVGSTPKRSNADFLGDFQTVVFPAVTGMIEVACATLARL